MRYNSGQDSDINNSRQHDSGSYCIIADRIVVYILADTIVADIKAGSRIVAEIIAGRRIVVDIKADKIVADR